MPKFNQGLEDVVPDEELEDCCVETYQNNARDLAIHRMNHERYVDMLKTIEPGPFRDRIEHLKTEVEGRIVEVEAICAATKKQMPADISSVLARLKVKRLG